MDFSNFDARNIEPPRPANDPIPAGWYKAVIAAAEEKTTKAQTGSYQQLQLEVIEGQYQGRKVFDNLNTNNPNQTAEDIAKRQVGAICRAVGVFTPSGWSDLQDRPLMIKVGIKPAKDGYEASNKITEYAAVDGAPAAAPAPVKTAATPPWKR
jgi:hypothetical protein